MTNQHKNYICPVTNKECGGLSKCNVNLEKLPKECVDKFNTAFRFFGVK